MKKKLFPIMVLAMSFLGSIAAFAEEATGATAAPSASPTPIPGPLDGLLNNIFPWGYIILYGGIIAAFYFLMIRPQKKKQKAEEELRNNIMMGDEITTIGGIVGRVVSIKDDDITIESSIDRTLVQFKKWAIRDIKKLETDDEPVAAPEEKSEEKKGFFARFKK